MPTRMSLREAHPADTVNVDAKVFQKGPTVGSHYVDFMVANLSIAADTMGAPDRLPAAQLGAVRLSRG